MQDFVNAADSYEQLTISHPEVDEYRLYYAQALNKACLYEEAMKVSCQIDGPKFGTKVSLAYKCFVHVQQLSGFTGRVR